jgi:chromosome partitioning protein
MQVLMLAKQKGGAGASTIARELGVVAAADGLRVVFVDLDPQASLSKWWNRRTAGIEGEPNPALATPRPEDLLDILEQLRATDAADLVVIDVPPSVHAFLGGIMFAVDLIFVPVRPTLDDFDALPDVVELIERSGRPFAFIISQAPPGRRIRAVEEALPILARQGRIAPLLRFRADFPAAAIEGNVATEIAPRGKAAEEVRELWAFARTELSKATRHLKPAAVPSSVKVS